MAAISQPNGVGQHRTTEAPAGTQKLINTAVTAWHAAFAGGAGDFDISAGFSQPNPLEADRIPELHLTAGGTPGTYTITGTWNGLARTAELETVADAPVRADEPFDEITRFQGPDPGAGKAVTLNKGDSYFSSPTRWIWTGEVGGVIGVQLKDEPATALKAVTLPASLDWHRAAVRVRANDGSALATTLTKPMAVW